MDKRYQVFVSSTYEDLKEERTDIIQTIMEFDCIPAGMELFPAADEEQFTFIKRIIDDCDYYVLIIGGRYGSLAPDGVSYTEKEFDYAVSKKIPVIAIIHENPSKLIAEKVDTDPAILQKLDNFKTKVKTGRIVKFWNTPNDLSGEVLKGLSKSNKMYKPVGWVRANRVVKEDILEELIQLRKENESLRPQKEFPETVAIDEIERVCLNFLISCCHNKYVDAFDILEQLQSQKVDYTTANLSLKSLEYEKGFLTSYKDHNENGYQCLKYEITDRGWSWIISHKNIFKKKAPPPPSDDDDVPF